MAEVCDCCRCSYEAIYWVPAYVWEEIKPKAEGYGGLLCIECANKRAKKAGFILRFNGSDGWWCCDGS